MKSHMIAVANEIREYFPGKLCWNISTNILNGKFDWYEKTSNPYAAAG